MHNHFGNKVLVHGWISSNRVRVGVDRRVNCEPHSVPNPDQPWNSKDSPPEVLPPFIELVVSISDLLWLEEHIRVDIWVQLVLSRQQIVLIGEWLDIGVMIVPVLFAIDLIVFALVTWIDPHTKMFVIVFRLQIVIFLVFTCASV